MIVMKFGGTSVGDARSIRQVAAIVRRELANRPVLVVSAHAGVTDMLLQLASAAASGGGDGSEVVALHRRILADLSLRADLLDSQLAELQDLVRGIRLVGAANPRAQDHLASFGERCSARTLAAFLGSEGIAATAIDAWDLGLLTDSAFGRARPLPDEGRIARNLAAVAGVPVITGFIGKDRDGNITTLGRNGTDFSAAWIGAAMSAAEIVVWKDVDGVRTADPKLVPGALPIRTMSFAEASELASFGSKVLHPATMAPAALRGIPVRVRNTQDPDAAGTLIIAGSEPNGTPVRAIAHRRGVHLLTVTAQRLLPQHAFLSKLFELLSARETEVGPVAVSTGAVTFGADAALADALSAELRQLGDVRVERDAAVVGVVGEGQAMARGAAAKVLATLAAAGVVVRATCQGAQGGTLAVVVADTDCRRAVQSLHAAFF